MDRFAAALAPDCRPLLDLAEMFGVTDASR
jgi:hypothetical protein